jgi:hypothetical protein
MKNKVRGQGQVSVDAHSGFIEYDSTQMAVRKPLDAITITKSGTIGLPMGFYIANDIKKFKFVALSFDPDTHTIGLRFLEERGDSLHAAITKDPPSSGSISVARFFQHFYIDYKAIAGTYPYQRRRSTVGPQYVVKLPRHGVRT